MCNRFNLRFRKADEPQPRWTYLLSVPNLIKEFIHKNQQFIKPEYKPTDAILNLRIDKSKTSLTDLNNINPSFDTWGAKPDWSDKPITNSRSEKLFTSPFWKPFITQNRCLIPVSSFFEWQEISGKKHKQEITFKNDSTCLAGLYGNWEEIGISRPGIWITILTQDGNSLMKQVHNSGDNRGRQPVVIREEDWEKWIHQKVSEQKEIERMITQFKEDEIEVASADRGNQPSLFGF